MAGIQECSSSRGNNRNRAKHEGRRVKYSDRDRDLGEDRLESRKILDEARLSKVRIANSGRELSSSHSGFHSVHICGKKTT